MGAQPVDVPALDARARDVCAGLVDSLPATVDGAERRETDPSDAPAAAWGDPAIVLTCGVPAPAGFDDFSTCQEIDGVGWYIPDEQVTGRPEPVTMTTIDREVNVQVTLPETHWPPAAAMVDLAPAVGDLRQTDPCV